MIESDLNSKFDIDTVPTSSFQTEGLTRSPVPFKVSDERFSSV